MNTPNPLSPQGAFERQAKGKSTVRIAIFTIVSIHAVFFAGLLMQGCRRDEANPPVQMAETLTNQNTLAPLDPDYYPAVQDPSAGVIAPPVPVPIPAVASEPEVAFTPAIAPEVEGRPYTIAKGDTLSAIAKLNGVTVAALRKANPAVEPSRMRPGQRIYIPGPGSASADLGYKEPAIGSESPVVANVHVVRQGDTLSRIARRNGTTVKALRAANKLKSDRLSIGQKLRLPASGGASAAASSMSRLTATNPAHVRPGADLDIH